MLGRLYLILLFILAIIPSLITHPNTVRSPSATNSTIALNVKPSSHISSSQSFSLYLPTVAQSLVCYSWAGQIDLQEAINNHICVEIQPGVWMTNVQIVIPSGHHLIGKNRDTTTLKAISPWQGNGGDNLAEAVVHNNDNTNVTVANFTIDANSLSTFGIGINGMVIDAMRITNAKCDGVAIAGTGMIVRDSIVEHNGKNCTNTGLPGSGIYITKRLNDPIANYAPWISGNRIRFNGGPGLDVDRVWNGIFRDNIVTDNTAWAAVSLFAASHWKIEGNRIHHPATSDPTHPGHPECMGGPDGSHSAGVSLCQSTDLADEVVVSNEILNNEITGWYGIRTVGNDEVHSTQVPRYNVFQNNNVYGSMIGCIDDFAPNQAPDGANTWNNNNCSGTEDTLPLYFDVLCPNGVRRSKVETWRIGATDVVTVNHYIDLFNAERTRGGFEAGDHIPAGVIVATNFAEAGMTWGQFPVQPVVHYESYGLFESTSTYTAPYAGACLLIIP